MSGASNKKGDPALGDTTTETGEDITSEHTVADMVPTSIGRHRVLVELEDVNQTGSGATLTIRVVITIGGVDYEIFNDDDIDVSSGETDVSKLSSAFHVKSISSTIAVHITSDDSGDSAVDIYTALIKE